MSTPAILLGIKIREIKKHLIIGALQILSCMGNSQKELLGSVNFLSKLALKVSSFFLVDDTSLS